MKTPIINNKGNPPFEIDEKTERYYLDLLARTQFYAKDDMYNSLVKALDGLIQKNSLQQICFESGLGKEKITLLKDKIDLYNSKKTSL